VAKVLGSSPSLVVSFLPKQFLFSFHYPLPTKLAVFCFW
jgi:hypothetical protein